MKEPPTEFKVFEYVCVVGVVSYAGNAIQKNTNKEAFQEQDKQINQTPSF